jgi:hypothetical protein
VYVTRNGIRSLPLLSFNTLLNSEENPITISITKSEKTETQISYLTSKPACLTPTDFSYLSNLIHEKNLKRSPSTKLKGTQFLLLSSPWLQWFGLTDKTLKQNILIPGKHRKPSLPGT